MSCPSSHRLIRWPVFRALAGTSAVWLLLRSGKKVALAELTCDFQVVQVLV